ncbi:MAG: Fic family protein [Bacteroidota bacterium]|nr:Fic family protein [Bacteroidota bacterium]
MNFKILTDKLIHDYTKVVKESPLVKIDNLKKVEIPVDYFQFYKSVSSVYSSKIEGEDIDFDSFFKHKFLKVKFKPDYTRKADDLFAAYDFIDNNRLVLANVKKAHSILSQSLLPKSQQGLIRNNPMFVINSDDKIEYVAAIPEKVKSELDKLFLDIELLIKSELNPFEVFYYASLLHLVFVKIHPFQDGNGRTARLIEKWFLLEKIGQKAIAVQLEKNYYKNLKQYYSNIRKIGLEYKDLDYNKSLDFLLMTVQGIDNQE